MFKEKIQTTWFRFARTLCRWSCRAFFRIRFEGLENIPAEGGFLLLCNHQSFLDPVLGGIVVKRPLWFVARDTLFKNPVFGRLLSSVQALPIKRGQADIRAMKAVIDKLKAGMGFLLFPEGTRSKDGRIVQIKPGFSLLCRRGNAAVVPVVIDGAFECWPRHKKRPSPGKISVTYGEAITAERIKELGDRKFADLLTQRLRQMQNQARIKAGKDVYNYQQDGISVEESE